MPIIIDEDILDAALAEARTVGALGGLAVKGLKAPLDPKQSNWVEQLWDTAEGAVHLAWEKGKQAASALLQKFEQQLVAMGAAIGAGAASVRSAVMQRLNRFFTSVVENAIERFQPHVTIAGKQVLLRSVTVEQKLKMSASLKSSLEEMCEFAAEGELTVAAEYGTD